MHIGYPATPPSDASARLPPTSPPPNSQYVPREWILKEAYTSAISGNYTLVHELQELFERPYDEHPEYERYYRGVGDLSATQGGLGFMS